MKRFLLYLSVLIFGLAGMVNAQNVVLSLPDTNVTVNTTNLNLPITVQNFDNIGAISLKISYDTAYATYQSIANEAASGINANEATAGEITIGWFSPDGTTPLNIADGGKLLDLVFDFSNGSTDVDFVASECEITDIDGNALTTTYVDGSISAPVIVSLSNVKASPGDTVVMPLSGFNLQDVGSVSLRIDYNDSVLDFVELRDEVVDFAANESGGTLTLGWFSPDGVTTLDVADGVMANIIFVYVDNSTTVDFFTLNDQSELTDINNDHIDATFVNGSVAKERYVALPDLQAAVGDTVTFPLTVTNLSTGSASLVINFDDNVLTFVNAVNGAGEILGSNAVSGVLTVGYADAVPAFETGTLFDLMFVYQGGTSDLDFDEALSEVTDENGIPYVGFDYVNGSVSLKPNSAPMFTSVLSDTMIAEGQLLEFDYEATDADNDPLTYSLITAPTGAAIDSTTGMFSWTPTFDQAGNHDIVAMVSDGITADTSVTSVVVVSDSNRVPSFTGVLPDTTIAEEETLTWQYTAIDPDDSALTFMLVEGPTGVSVSETGMLTWTPTLDQEGGPYTIVVSVTDGLYTISDTAEVTVTRTNQEPEFTSVMPNQTINPPWQTEITYQYEATDPDGDDLTFSLVDAPSGASITNDGAFTFMQDQAAADTSLVIIVAVSDGQATVLDTAEIIVVSDVETDGIPTEYKLSQNYPNPFNPSTVINFDLPERAVVTLKVYNLLGEEIVTLVNREMNAGYHQYNFDASNLTTGAYIYRIQAGDYVATKKMLLIK